MSVLFKPNMLTYRCLFKRLGVVSSTGVRSAHHGGGHFDEDKLKQLLPIDKKTVKDPELLKHIEGLEKVLRENYAEPPDSPDPWTLDPVKIAKDPLHCLHGIDPSLYPGTMNEHPLPTLNWAEAYARQQRNFNLAMLFTATLFTITCFVVYNHPVMQFRFSPPTDITDLDWNPDDDPDVRF